MTTDDAKALVRSLIKESTAKFWTDTEITLYLSTAMQMTWGKYSNLLYELKKSWDYISLAAGKSVYDKPTNCFKIGKIVVTESGAKVGYVHDDELFKYSIIPGADAENYFTCFYLPSYSDITSFPEVLQPVVCIEAAILAKTKDENVTQDLLALRDWHELAAVNELGIEAIAQVNVFPDFREEDSLDSGYAWTYKADKICFLEPRSYA